MTIKYYYKEIIDKNNVNTNQFSIFMETLEAIGDSKTHIARKKIATALYERNAKIIVAALNKFKVEPEELLRYMEEDYGKSTRNL